MSVWLALLGLVSKHSTGLSGAVVKSLSGQKFDQSSIFNLRNNVFSGSQNVILLLMHSGFHVLLRIY